MIAVVVWEGRAVLILDNNDTSDCKEDGGGEGRATRFGAWEA